MIRGTKRNQLTRPVYYDITLNCHLIISHCKDKKQIRNLNYGRHHDEFLQSSSVHQIAIAI